MKWPWRKTPPTTPEGDAAAELVARVRMVVRDAESRVDALRASLTERLALRQHPDDVGDTQHATDP